MSGFRPRNPHTTNIFTTGSIAKLVGAAARTVSEWIDKGDLIGYRLPGRSQDRRVERKDLIEFCVRYKIKHALETLLQLTTVAIVGFTTVEERTIRGWAGSLDYTVRPHESIPDVVADGLAGHVICGAAAEGTTAIRSLGQYLQFYRPWVRTVVVLDAAATADDVARMTASGWDVVVTSVDAVCDLPATGPTL